jgi:hypothetical protein
MTETDSVSETLCVFRISDSGQVQKRSNPKLPRSRVSLFVITENCEFVKSEDVHYDALEIYLSYGRS